MWTICTHLSALHFFFLLRVLCTLRCVHHVFLRTLKKKKTQGREEEHKKEKEEINAEGQKEGIGTVVLITCAFSVAVFLSLFLLFGSLLLFCLALVCSAEGSLLRLPLHHSPLSIYISFFFKNVQRATR
jgi:quinol-cytochrome oxidoreductase complex cytochrome b subunit